MEWILNEGDTVKQIACVNDIATAVKNVMNDSSEFVILTPPEPIGDCNFMQASKISEDNLHFEVSIVQSSGKNRVYSKACNLDTAIFLFGLLRVNMVLDPEKSGIFAPKFYDKYYGTD